MNSSKLFNKVFEQSRENVMMNKMNSTLSADSPLLAQIHRTALNNPSYSVEQLLKLNNTSYNQYLNLIKSGFSIPQIRKLQLGKTRELTAAQKVSVTSRLKKSSSKKTSRSVNSRRGMGSDDVNYLSGKMQSRKSDFDLDDA